MMVSADCPTAISSLNERECENDDITTDPGVGARITQSLLYLCSEGVGRGNMSTVKRQS